MINGSPIGSSHTRLTCTPAKDQSRHENSGGDFDDEVGGEGHPRELGDIVHGGCQTVLRAVMTVSQSIRCVLGVVIMDKLTRRGRAQSTCRRCSHTWNHQPERQSRWECGLYGSKTYPKTNLSRTAQ